MKTFSDKMSEMQDKLGVTAYRLNALFGIDRSLISKVKNGNIKPSLKTYLMLKEAYEILGEDENKFTNEDASEFYELFKRDFLDTKDKLVEDLFLGTLSGIITKKFKNEDFTKMSPTVEAAIIDFIEKGVQDEKDIFIYLPFRSKKIYALLADLDKRGYTKSVTDFVSINEACNINELAITILLASVDGSKAYQPRLLPRGESLDAVMYFVYTGDSSLLIDNEMENVELVETPTLNKLFENNIKIIEEKSVVFKPEFISLAQVDKIMIDLPIVTKIIRDIPPLEHSLKVVLDDEEELSPELEKVKDLLDSKVKLRVPANKRATTCVTLSGLRKFAKDGRLRCLPELEGLSLSPIFRKKVLKEFASAISRSKIGQLRVVREHYKFPQKLNLIYIEDSCLIVEIFSGENKYVKIDEKIIVNFILDYLRVFKKVGGDLSRKDSELAVRHLAQTISEETS